MNREVRRELIASIQSEAEGRRARSAADIVAGVRGGDFAKATGDLLFFTQPEWLEQRLDEIFEELSGKDSSPVLEFFIKLAVDLQSFLPEWNLRPRMDHGTIAGLAEAVIEQLGRHEERNAGMAKEALAELRRRHTARIIAEGVDAEEAATEADSLVGNSVSGYVRNMGALIRESNLFSASIARRRGELTTEIGNDYAVFLQHVIWMGGSFCTTNPVLIKVAWDTDPGYWNDKVDGVIRNTHTPEEIGQLLEGPVEKLEEAVFALNSSITMAVVLENCRLLRDIFLHTGGSQGYVSLQVNPTIHDDAERMVNEARELYGQLEDALCGVPNVVFKLPSTAPGLAAAEALTSEGVGVTITLTFSVFQSLGFAEVLRRGNQLTSYIAIMNGRMAFPVRDELVRLGVSGGEEAARLAGVAVARKAAKLLYAPGSSSWSEGGDERVKIMVASLRIYDDGTPEGWIPDVSELWGIPLITVFPNVRRSFDLGDRPLSPTINEIPEDTLDKLCGSRIFRQAWWVTGDGDTRRPDVPITLAEADTRLLTSWQPVSDTLHQFIENYRQMGDMVVERLRAVAGDG